jgi:hypothetical protein
LNGPDCFFAFFPANEFGYRFSEEPFLRVHPFGLITAEGILKKEIELNEYDLLFHQEPNEDEKQNLDRYLVDY